MRNNWIRIFTVLTIIGLSATQLVYAQDTIKKTVVKKPLVTKTSTTVIQPAGAKPAIPINPKTGKPYSKWGYGPYAKAKYDAAAIHKADSLKKVAAAKPAVVAAPVKPVVVAAPVKPAPAPVVTAPNPDSVAAAAAASKSLSGQYHYLLTKVYNYQQPFVAALWKNVVDTLNANRRKLVDAQAKVAEQAKTISDLQTDAKAKDELVTKADDINLVGISLSKDAYNIIMWGLVIICGAIAAIVIFRTGSLKHEATYRTNLYSELEEEFKTYKSKANEKEKKLARELQTERNKVDELMGKG